MLMKIMVRQHMLPEQCLILVKHVLHHTLPALFPILVKQYVAQHTPFLILLRIVLHQHMLPESFLILIAWIHCPAYFSRIIANFSDNAVCQHMFPESFLIILKIMLQTLPEPFLCLVNTLRINARYHEHF